MRYLTRLLTVIIGLSGIVAQALILRELLIVFYGNELTLGIMLACWLISEAAGVFIIGKAADKLKDKAGSLLILNSVFSLYFPFAIYLARVMKVWLGIPFGEVIGLGQVSLISGIIVFLLAFTHGGLFGLCCLVASIYEKDNSRTIGRVYALETIGTIAGGIIFTYILIPFMNSFEIAYLVPVINIAVGAMYLRQARGRISRFIFVAVSLGFLFTLFLGLPRALQKDTVSKVFGGQPVVDYRNSVHGNIALVEREGQRTYFYNGIPAISVPYPDIGFVEEFGQLPLLFHEKPRKVLLIGAGAGGLINEMLKHPLESIDYAELDPLLITMLKKYPSEMTEKELSDKRVKIANVDGRLYLKRSADKYDIIMMGFSNQSELSTNRLFTEEFFNLASKKLSSGGIVAFWVTGSTTYLSSQLRDLNASILNGVKTNFPYIRVIPGDINIYLASGSRQIMHVDTQVIQERINTRGIKTFTLVKGYLEYKFQQRFLDWFNDSMRNATSKINRDFAPWAVYENLLMWNRIFSPVFATLLEKMQSMLLRYWLLLIAAASLILGLATFRRGPSGERARSLYCIFSAGFFGMLVSLVLNFSYQVLHGYLYQHIGMLISLFMSGVALGSLFVNARIQEARNIEGLVKRIEVAMVLFPLAVAYAITHLRVLNEGLSLLIFIILFVVSGFLVGAEFPAVNKIILKNSGIGRTSGAIYAADILGGCFAAVIGAIFLLPVLGFVNACILCSFLKISSLVLFSLK